MRYFILAAVLSAAYYAFTATVAPQLAEGPSFNFGIFLCCLISLIITWNDKPDIILTTIAGYIIKYGTVAAVMVFAVWGAGYKLKIWGDHSSGGDFGDFISVFSPVGMMSSVAVLLGVIMLCFIVYRGIRKKD